MASEIAGKILRFGCPPAALLELVGTCIRYVPDALQGQPDDANHLWRGPLF